MKKWGIDWEWIFQRIREPSTWAGFGVLAASVGFAVGPGVIAILTTVGATVGALGAIVLEEKPRD